MNTTGSLLARVVAPAALLVALTVPAAVAQSGSTSRPETSTDKPSHRFGVGRTTDVDANAPTFYIVPMKGQMGTDIHVDIYKQIVDDINEHDPDYVIIEMECRDSEDRLYSTTGSEEAGLIKFDDYRALVRLFRDDLRAHRQILWIHDSVGISSMVALAWDELYMKPHARFGGLAPLEQIFSGWKDDDVRGKMTEAFMGMATGFVQKGGYSDALADAMILSDKVLSASFYGREVVWTLDTNGEFVVDGSEQRTANFRAKDAEDLLISDGTAGELDDLALLLGIREYRVSEGNAEDLLTGYVEDWRRQFEKTKTWWADVAQYRAWAQGEDALKYLGKAKGAIEKIIASMNRYPAIETRWQREKGMGGWNRHTLQVEAEQIGEQIRALRKNRGGRGGGGGAAGGGGLGGGGRGR